MAIKIWQELTDCWLLSSWNLEASMRSQSHSTSVFSTQKAENKRKMIALFECCSICLYTYKCVITYINSKSCWTVPAWSHDHGLTLFAGEWFLFVSSRIEMNWRYSEFFHLPYPFGKKNKHKGKKTPERSKWSAQDTKTFCRKNLKGVFSMLTGNRPCASVSMLMESYWHAAYVVISKDEWTKWVLACPSVEISCLTSKTSHS